MRAFQRAILLKLKTKPSLVRETGTGDMNIFAHRKSAACVTYGPGLSQVILMARWCRSKTTSAASKC